MGRATKKENHHDPTDDRVGIVVDDLAAATEFFVELAEQIS